MTSTMPMAISQQPATRVRTAIESIGEMISTPPPITMITPENACQPRPGRWSKDSAEASRVNPRNTQLMPIHSANEHDATRVCRGSRRTPAPATRCR